MQPLVPVGLTDRQVFLLKDLTETEIECRYEHGGLTPEDIALLRELIEMNLALCMTGGLEETQTGIYQECKETIAELTGKEF